MLRKLLAGLSLSLALAGSGQAVAQESQEKEPENSFSLEQSSGSGYYYPATTRLEFSNTDMRLMALPSNDYIGNSSELFLSFAKPLGKARLGFAGAYINSEPESPGFGIGPEFSWSGDSIKVKGQYVSHGHEEHGHVTLNTRYANVGISRDSGLDDWSYFASFNLGSTYITLGEKNSVRKANFILEPEENGSVGVFNITEFNPNPVAGGLEWEWPYISKFYGRPCSPPGCSIIIIKPTSNPYLS